MLRTHIHRAGIVCALLLGVPCFAIAQQATAPAPSTDASRAIPRPDELEPGVNTTLAAPAASPAVPTAAPAAAPAATAPAARATNTPPAKPAAKPENAATAKATTRPGSDRLELDTTDITGNRELPKVLYIVPWKRSDLGDVVGKPVNSLLDEVLQPLDRDVFQRENRYYDDLKPGAGGAKAGAASGSPTKP